MTHSPLRWLLAVVALLSISLAGCSLAAQPPQPPTDEPIPTATDLPPLIETGTEQASPTPFPTFTPFPTAIPTATGIPTSAAPPTASPTPCTIIVPSGWTPYVIQGGDTLSSIASAAGTSAGQLATTNCISNPNLIAVGQLIYTPPIANAPFELGLPDATTVRGETVVPQGPVTFTGVNYPGTAAQVAFTYQPLAGGATQTLGIDTNLADGASIQFNVPNTFRGSVRASAQNSSGGLVQQSPQRQVSAATFTNGPFTVGSPQTIQSDGGFVLPQGAITFTAVNFPLGATRIDWTYTPQQTNPPTTTIGSDSELADGAQFGFTVNPDFRGTVTPIAFNAAGAIILQGQPQLYAAEGPPQPFRIEPLNVAQTDGYYQFAIGANTIEAVNIPSGTVRVDFYSAPTATGSTPTLFAADSNFNDGVRGVFTGTEGSTVNLYAVALNADGVQLNSTDPILVRVPDENNFTVSIPAGTPDGERLLLPVGDVQLNASGPPVGTTRVDFLYRATGTNTDSVVGTDSNLNDGITLTVPISADVDGVLSAQARNNNGIVLASSNALSIAALPEDDDEPEQAVLSLQPNPATLTGDGSYDVEAGVAVTLTAGDLPQNAARVDFFVGDSPDYAAATLVGADAALGDGATAQTTFPSNVTRFVGARALDTNGVVIGQAPFIEVTSVIPADDGGDAGDDPGDAGGDAGDAGDDVGDDDTGEVVTINFFIEEGTPVGDTAWTVPAGAVLTLGVTAFPQATARVDFLLGEVADFDQATLVGADTDFTPLPDDPLAMGPVARAQTFFPDEETRFVAARALDSNGVVIGVTPFFAVTSTASAEDDDSGEETPEVTAEVTEEAPEVPEVTPEVTEEAPEVETPEVTEEAAPSGIVPPAAGS